MAEAGDQRRRWSKYYTAKRIGQQWLQVDLLNGLPGTRVIEIGPYLGLVTAMLAHAGYDVTMLDHGPRRFARPATPHIEADLLTLEPARVQGFDTILCCETLEHLPWGSVPAVLATLHGSGARHLVVSVPYEAFQIGLSFYANRHHAEHALQVKKLRFLRRFRPLPDGGGQWEIGYRGHSLRGWERTLTCAGWRIARRAFTHPCRSVFHVVQRR